MTVFRVIATKALLLCIYARLAVACSDSATSSAAIPAARDTAQVKPGNFKVAGVLKSFTNPFFVEMAKGARLAQAERGIELEIKTSTPETSAEQQIRLVNSQIKAGVNAIVISPVDTRLLVAVGKHIQIGLQRFRGARFAGQLQAQGRHFGGAKVVIAPGAAQFAARYLLVLQAQHRHTQKLKVTADKGTQPVDMAVVNYAGLLVEIETLVVGGIKQAFAR
jgi:hypothetical protein